MIELLLECLKDDFEFSLEEFSTIERHFVFYKKRKRDFLLKEGGQSADYFLLLDGYARTFYLSEAGTEVTIELLGKGEFAASMYSILKGAPSFENIQCITDCLVCKIAEPSFEALSLKDPRWIRFGMKHLKQALLKKEERILSFGKLKGKARYAKLIAEKPDFIHHIPVQYLASYLGMKPESLSRIRS
ncbi:cAMP-binding domain of CRP or a regulatory subunit of cAMP-dependent protein kinases [Pedobacter caeni]|uniref:cAMP-binding domain of CRP or a regulatory subunit of cAMP-dependent protein kinases n=2 Tax=Pedobacter caeni TaxID=288992 RepID=A0A1M5EH55_9SPHI|nr:cAMP-binding domain of CRP or a regulatory subunit of cAMP-dependent protein kinases [Pedobacter caeni]